MMAEETIITMDIDKSEVQASEDSETAAMR
jgi:hypothetical protein